MLLGLLSFLLSWTRDVLDFAKRLGVSSFYFLASLFFAGWVTSVTAFGLTSLTELSTFCDGFFCLRTPVLVQDDGTYRLLRFCARHGGWTGLSYLPAFIDSTRIGISSPGKGNNRNTKQKKNICKCGLSVGV